MIEVHDLRAEMQMASGFQNTARVVKHPANCQAQLVEIEAGSVT